MNKPELASPLTDEDQILSFAQSFPLDADERGRLYRGVKSAFDDGLKSGVVQEAGKVTYGGVHAAAPVPDPE